MRILAVRALHCALGLPDPLAGCPRVGQSPAGLERRQGQRGRNKSATPPTPRGVCRGLDPAGPRDDAFLWPALLLAFFLLRSSEYLTPDGGARDPNKGVRGLDLVARQDEDPTAYFAVADEIVLTIRGIRVDQINRGEIRNHFAAHDVNRPRGVQAAAWTQLWAPERFTGAHAAEPLLSWADGTRTDAQGVASARPKADLTLV